MRDRVQVDFDLCGPHGLLAHIEKVLKKQQHAVIAVAEGIRCVRACIKVCTRFAFAKDKVPFMRNFGVV